MITLVCKGSDRIGIDIDTIPCRYIGTAKIISVRTVRRAILSSIIPVIGDERIKIVENEIIVLRFEIEIIDARSEEDTSELKSLMRISYAVFCLKKIIIFHNKNPQKRYE